jgi:hypothetical protein
MVPTFTFSKVVVTIASVCCPTWAELMTRGGREIAQRSEARIALAIVRKHLANCWEEWFGCHGQNLRN